MGIDMSKAFDTIRRDVISNILKDEGWSEDDVRIVKCLLSDTKLKIKVKIVNQVNSQLL